MCNLDNPIGDRLQSTAEGDGTKKKTGPFCAERQLGLTDNSFASWGDPLGTVANTHTRKKEGNHVTVMGSRSIVTHAYRLLSTHETNTHAQEAFSAVSCCVCMGCSYYTILRSIDATYTQYRLVLLSCCSVSFMCTKQRGLGRQRKISCPPLSTPPFSKKTICSRLSIQQFLF